VNYYFRKRKYSVSQLQEFPAYNFSFSNEQYLTEKELFKKELSLHSEFLKVQQALQKLDIKYQEVLSLRYFEKKSINEMAGILGKKEGTVNHFYREELKN